jgi:hypothetical protein
MQSKEYKLPNGKTAVFEYDVYGIGKVTLESMDELMSMIADRPQGEWIKDDLGTVICSECKRPRRDNRVNHINFCNSCGARMKGADDES